MPNILVYSNIGLVRKSHDDYCLVDDVFLNSSDEFNKVPKTLAVFDGVGSLENSHQTARLAAQYLSKNLDYSNIKETIININSELLKTNINNAATTVAGISFNNNDIFVFNMGDSSVYRLRSNLLVKLSYDHSLTNLQLKNNPFLKIEDIDPRSNNTITSYLPKTNINLEEDLNINEQFFGVMENDIFLLTTDGVTDLVKEIELLAILTNDKISLIEKQEEIIKVVLERGATDNFSFILYEVR